MNACTHTEDRLDDLLDGLLDDAARSTLEEHLAHCTSCTASLADLRALRAETRSLPRELPPPAGLWNDVASATSAAALTGPAARHGAGTWTWGLAAAAAALIVALALVLTRESTSPPAPASVSTAAAVPAATSGGASPAALAAFQDAALRYREAAEALQVALAAVRTELPPDARAALDHNLALIDASIADTENLMRQEPGQPEYGHRLLALYQQKLDVLDGASRWGLAQ